MVGYTVNGLMESRHRSFFGIYWEMFRRLGSEMDGGRELVDRFQEAHLLRWCL